MQLGAFAAATRVMRSKNHLAYYIVLAAISVLCACSDEMQVRIPEDESENQKGPPYGAEFCFPRAYDNVTIYQFDLGYSRYVTHLAPAARISFVYPSLEPARHQHRHEPGKLNITIQPGNEDVTDYSRSYSRQGARAIHPLVSPSSEAVELRRSEENESANQNLYGPPPELFPDFLSDRYAVIPIDEEWRRRFAMVCQGASCGVDFESAQGFSVRLIGRPDDLYDLPSVMAAVNTLLDRFIANCEP